MFQKIIPGVITIRKYAMVVVIICLTMFLLRRPEAVTCIAVLNGESVEIGQVRITYNGKSVPLPNVVVEGNRLILPAKEFGGGEEALSLFEIAERFNLVCDFNQETNSVDLHSNEKMINPKEVNGERQALIRIEDIAPLGGDARPDMYLRLRIIADYLYEQGVPFCIALVPRYINPEHEIDNDPANEYSFSNLEFVYTIDYMVGHGGTVGLHGYTHRRELGKSLDDIEFGPDVSLEETEELFRLAKDAVRKMGFTPEFFVFPHYVCTDDQLALAIREFGTVYQSPNNMVTYFPTKDGIARAVPAPLEYFVPTDDIEEKLSELEALPGNTLMSFFFHPFLEYDSIKISRTAGIAPTWWYDENSLLHKVIRAAHNAGAGFVPISEIQ